MTIRFTRPPLEIEFLREFFEVRARGTEEDRLQALANCHRAALDDLAEHATPRGCDCYEPHEGGIRCISTRTTMQVEYTRSEDDPYAVGLGIYRRGRKIIGISHYFRALMTAELQAAVERLRDACPQLLDEVSEFVDVGRVNQFTSEDAMEALKRPPTNPPEMVFLDTICLWEGDVLVDAISPYPGRPLPHVFSLFCALQAALAMVYDTSRPIDRQRPVGAATRRRLEELLDALPLPIILARGDDPKVESHQVEITSSGALLVTRDGVNPAVASARLATLPHNATRN